MRNEENTEAATLEAALSEENVREAWLAVKANGGAPTTPSGKRKATSAKGRHGWSTST